MNELESGKAANWAFLTAKSMIEAVRTDLPPIDHWYPGLALMVAKIDELGRMDDEIRSMRARRMFERCVDAGTHDAGELDAHCELL